LTSISRRKLLGSATVVGGAAALAACTTAQVANFDAQWAAAQSWIAQQVQNITKVLPTIESIAATAAGLFGPTYQAIVAAGTAVANTIVQTIVNVVNAAAPPATPAASLKFKKMLSGVAVAQVTVGTTPPLPFALGGVPITVVK